MCGEWDREGERLGQEGLSSVMEQGGSISSPLGREGAGKALHCCFKCKVSMKESPSPISALSARLQEGGYLTDLVREEAMEKIKQGSVRGTPKTGNGEPMLSALPRES